MVAVEILHDPPARFHQGGVGEEDGLLDDRAVGAFFRDGRADRAEGVVGLFVERLAALRRRRRHNVADIAQIDRRGTDPFPAGLANRLIGHTGSFPGVSGAGGSAESLHSRLAGRTSSARLAGRFWFGGERVQRRRVQDSSIIERPAAKHPHAAASPNRRMRPAESPP